MGKNRQVLCHGVTYNNISTLCEAYHAPYASVLRYIHNGVTPEQAIEKSLSRPLRVQDDNGNEIVYKNARILCEQCNVNYSTFLSKCREGKSANEALQITRNLSNRNVKTAKEECSKLGISYWSYRALRRNGLTKEAALSAAYQKQFTQGIVYGGKRYKSRSELCRDCNLSLSKLGRLLRTGSSLEDAVAKSRIDNLQPALRTRAIPIRVNGEEYPSQRAYCRAHGLSIGQFQSHVKCGKIIIDSDDQKNTD